MDTYRNFRDLKNHEKEGRDFTISYRHTDSDFAVLAPHGGGIEPGTIDIADAVAGNEHNYYSFKGIKLAGNEILHITSTHFDEPAALQTVGRAKVAVAIHGCKGSDATICIGGRNRQLRKKLLDALTTAGFQVVPSDSHDLQGMHAENICNRCTSGQGVQLEISQGLREKLFDHLDHHAPSRTTALFNRFIRAVRTALC